MAGQLTATSPAHAVTPSPAEREASQTSGRTSSRNVTLLFDNELLGEIVLRIEPGGAALVPKAALIDMLLPAIDGDKPALSRLEAMKETKGYVTLGVLQAAGLSIGFDKKQLRLARAAPAPVAGKPVERASGRVSLLDLSLTSGGNKLGEIAAEVIGSEVRLPKAALLDMLTPVFDRDKAAMARLQALPEADGHVALSALEAAGFAAKLDRKRLDIARPAGGAVAAPAAAAPPGNPPQPEPPPEAAKTAAPPPIGPEGRLVRLKHGGEVMGEIMLRSGSENAVLLPKAALVDMLTPALEKDADALAKLEAVPDSDGQVTLDALKKAGLEVRLAHSHIEFGKPGAETEPKGYAKAMSSRLNPTDRTISLNVPLKDGDTQLGEIPVRIEPDGTVLVPKAALVQQLAPVLDKAALARLEKMPDKNGLVALGDLGGASFRLAYDPNQLELAFSPAVEQRALSELSLARQKAAVGGKLAQPAAVSGYLNIVGGADHRWDSAGPSSLGLGQAQATSVYFDLQSALRLAGIVFENDASLEGEIDPQQCPVGASCVYEHKAGLKRRRSRLVYDLPEELVRVQAGDVEQAASTFQRANDVLGVSIEKSARKLAPGESVRPSGSGAFSLEREADVEILVNGAVTQRLRLKPGNYNIRDLPLNAGANDIELVITDDRGQRRSLAFSTFSDANMLAAGKSEWALSGGLGSYFIDGERAYRPEDYLASGLVRYGLTDGLTLETQAKGDVNVTEGGAGLLTATPFGSWGLHGATSASDMGPGYAASVNWDLINFTGLLGTLSGARESLRLAAEYRSTEFRTPGEFVTTASGILYPQVPYWMRLSGSYSVPIGWGATATLAARYQFVDPEQFTLTPLVVQGDRYGADVTLSAPLGQAVSASLTAGVSNESYQVSLGSLVQDDSPEARVMVRLFVRPDEKTRLSASYDSLHNASYVSGHRSAGGGLDRWEGDVNLYNTGDEQKASANGSLAYMGNRGEVRLAHTGNFDGVDWQEANPTSQEQRTSLRVGTGLAFAGGHFAVGQPVRGGAFAIVHPHESLAGNEISVGAGGEARARANGLGPALVTDVPAYTRSTIPVDVADLPVGYSLGAGAFDILAPYRAGYALEVGTASSVSAYGTLLLADFSPCALVTGTAHPVDNPLQQVAVFTNKAGRFGAEGLAPGKWIIEMATEGGPTRYEIEVPPGTDGLFQAGLLMPAGAE